MPTQVCQLWFVVLRHLKADTEMDTLLLAANTSFLVIPWIDISFKTLNTDLEVYWDTIKIALSCHKSQCT